MQVILDGATFDAELAALGDRLPDAAEYQRFTTLVIDYPEAAALARLDPFSAAYRDGARALYARLRGRAEQDYIAERDEAPATGVPEDLWTGLVPWSFGDARMVGEFLHAWGHIFEHLALEKGGSVLEYGPGSGQTLLMLARMGYRAQGVDIDAVAVETVRRQAAALGLGVRVEQGLFGEGFGTERFDRILFFEAFHHSFAFPALLERLHGRLNPGGFVVLCGEPVVEAEIASIPYPWGPRLDALSVFCMRRFGWMELGFTRDFFVEAARRAGWWVESFPFPRCGRAHVHVLRPGPAPPPNPPAPAPAPNPDATAIAALRAEIAALRASTSWRITAPLRAARRWLGKA